MIENLRDENLKNEQENYIDNLRQKYGDEVVRSSFFKISLEDYNFWKLNEEQKTILIEDKFHKCSIWLDKIARIEKID